MDTPKRPNMRKLQGMIDRTAKANSKAHAIEKKLAAYCEEIYGCTWSDVDADSIIDAVADGCGASVGMTAAEFDAEMRQCIEAKG